jgi:hypothetical protein
MRVLKAEADENIRMTRVNAIVKDIYEYAVSQARCYAGTSYEENVSDREAWNFIQANMTDILRLLQELFPGCLVMKKRLVTGQDGKVYDMALMDEKTLPFVNQSHVRVYITIDWT